MAEQWIIADQIFDGETLRTGTALCLQDGVATALIPYAHIPRDASPIAITGLVTPGFIDLQVNGGGGVLFNLDPTPDGIAAIAAAHHALGTVAIMPTVISDTPQVLAAAVDAALAAQGRPYFTGLHIEGPHIALAKRGTHDACYIRPLDQVTLDHVGRLRAGGVPVMITLAPEAATLDQIGALAAMGATVSLGHSDCTADQAQTAFLAGARCVTHLYNAMSRMEGRAPGLVGAAINSDAYIGMICDGVHVADAMIALALRARPVPDRSFIVSDAMPTVGGPDAFTLYGQTIHVQDGRLVNAEGRLAGAHTTMAAGVARLVHQIGLPLQSALRMAVTVPAQLLGFPLLAQITGRQTTDLMVLDAGLHLCGTVDTVTQDAIGKHRA